MFKRLRDAWTVPEFKEKLTIGDKYYPGADVKTDEDIKKFIRSSIIPVSHASATCKMGKESDDMAVVDSHGKVFGVKNCEWFCPPIAPVLGSTSRRLTLK